MDYWWYSSVETVSMLYKQACYTQAEYPQVGSRLLGLFACACCRSRLPADWLIFPQVGEALAGGARMRPADNPLWRYMWTARLDEPDEPNLRSAVGLIMADLFNLNEADEVAHLCGYERPGLGADFVKCVFGPI